MTEKYINLYSSYKKLDIEDKKEELLNIVHDMIRLIYLENNKINNYNDDININREYLDDDEYLDLLFNYVLILREENDKLIEKVENLD